MQGCTLPSTPGVVLANGRAYYLRNYRVRNNCTSAFPPPSIATSPQPLVVMGVPSAPLNATFNFSCGDATCSLQVDWLRSADSGVGANASTRLDLTYNVAVLTAASAPCPAYADVSGQAAVSSLEGPELSQVVTSLTKGQLYCIYIRAKNGKLDLYSPAASLLARPVGASKAPTALALTINPYNWTNASLGAGSSLGVISWGPPDDIGAGNGAAGRNVSTVSVVYYLLEVTNQCSGAVDTYNTTATRVTADLTYMCRYTIRVRAVTDQVASVGAFFAEGRVSEREVYVTRPANMSVDFVGQTDGVHVTAYPSGGADVVVVVFVGSPMQVTLRAAMEDLSPDPAGASPGTLGLQLVQSYPQLPAGAVGFQVVNLTQSSGAWGGAPGGGGLIAMAVVSIEATPDMLKSSYSAYRSCVVAVGGTLAVEGLSLAADNVRSRVCLSIVVIKPAPAIVPIKVDYMGTVGCLTSIYLNASDNTEVQTPPFLPSPLPPLSVSLLLTLSRSLSLARSHMSGQSLYRVTDGWQAVLLGAGQRVAARVEGWCSEGLGQRVGADRCRSKVTQ